MTAPFLNDAARATLVVAQGAVSSQHATVMLDRMMVVDHGSTSGTYLVGQQIPANQPVPIDPNGIIAFGPVPVPVSLLMQIAQSSAGAPAQQQALLVDNPMQLYGFRADERITR